MIFRFDDVCSNADMKNHVEITDFILKKFPGAQIIWAYSPMVCSSEKKTQRVFPKKWNAFSDYRQFYKMDAISFMVDVPKIVEIASHGLVHCDHRLMPYAAQELSIVLSCSLTNSNMFIPPFNKWNQDTEKICKEHGIKLIKFEDGWLSAEYNDFTEENRLWYLHAREWNYEEFVRWLN